jgi:hypothetical protein
MGDSFDRMKIDLVPEPPRIPFIRITRPYGSEREFIEGDFGWVGRTTVVLPGGPARSAGELIRFEVVLTNGAPILRGEGHVVAHHTPGGPRPAGLEVRFTRVDAKSKLVLDRVREHRAAHGHGQSGTYSAPSPEAIAAAKRSFTPPKLSFPQVAGSRNERSGVRLTATGGRVAPPENRDAILERMRVRAREMATAGVTYKKRSG